jgi:hypothetical protein
MIGQIMGAVIMLVIGYYLVDLTGTNVDEVIYNSNATSSLASSPMTRTLLEYIPAFFGIAVTMCAIMVALGDVEIQNDDVEEEQPKPVKPKKQTYEEFVDEKLRVERKLG